jgi:hypothetical protein
MKMNNLLQISMISIILVSGFCLNPAVGQNSSATIYVDVEAPGNNDGTSWIDAYTELQPALELAVSGDQVWVAAGTYLPTEEHCGSGDRYKSFQLKNGVALYGGFDPTTGDVGWDDRDWVANPTILSGDIGLAGNNSDNSYHVFCHPDGLGLDSSAVMDGFLIQDGNANSNHPDDDGGGMFNASSSPTLKNITFSNNNADVVGGMENKTSSPSLTNITFSENSATGNGVGIANSPHLPF